VTGRWQPFSARLRGEELEEALHEGVPQHLRGPLEAWLADSTDDGLQRRVAARVRADLGRNYEPYQDFEDEQLLDAVDFVLSVGIKPKYGSGPRPKDLLVELRNLLVDGGSAYRVNDDGQGLERRVDPTVAGAVRQAVRAAQATPAAAHLRAAWTAAYGLHPDPPAAYSQMIKAVEAAAQPLIEPANAKATLGTMIRVLENAPDRFQLCLAGPKDQAGAVVVTAMCRILWQGQTSRHGSSQPTRHETQAEAETALQLAVALVSWFTTGALQRL
jgi:hypothetical protein